MDIFIGHVLYFIRFLFVQLQMPLICPVLIISIEVINLHNYKKNQLIKNKKKIKCGFKKYNYL